MIGKLIIFPSLRRSPKPLPNKKLTKMCNDTTRDYQPEKLEIPVNVDMLNAKVRRIKYHQ